MEIGHITRKDKSEEKTWRNTDTIVRYLYRTGLDKLSTDCIIVRLMEILDEKMTLLDEKIEFEMFLSKKLTKEEIEDIIEKYPNFANTMNLR